MNALRPRAQLAPSTAVVLAVAMAVSVCAVAEASAGSTVAAMASQPRFLSNEERQALGQILDQLHDAARDMGLLHDVDLDGSGARQPAAVTVPVARATSSAHDAQVHAPAPPPCNAPPPAPPLREHLADLPPPLPLAV